MEKSIKIPSTYEGKAVTQIAKDGFYDGQMKEIIIPSGVTHIGENAFSGAYELKSFSLPDTVKVISSSAFSNVIDTNLFAESDFEYLVIPTSVEYIDDNAFDSDLKLYYKGTTDQFSTIKDWDLIDGEWVEVSYVADSTEKWFFYSDDVSDISEYLSDERTAKGLWKYNDKQEIESVAIEYSDTVNGNTYEYTNSVVTLTDEYWQMLLSAKDQGMLETVLSPEQVTMFNESANKEEFATKLSNLNATLLQDMTVVFADGKFTLWQKDAQYSQPFDYLEVNGSIYYSVRSVYTKAYVIENGKIVEDSSTEYGGAKHYYELKA